MLKEIPLMSIKKAIQCGLNMSGETESLSGQKCLFLLKTEAETYFCGMDAEIQNSMNVLARNFYNIFKMAYLPYGSKSIFFY